MSWWIAGGAGLSLLVALTCTAWILFRKLSAAWHFTGAIIMALVGAATTALCFSGVYLISHVLLRPETSPDFAWLGRADFLIFVASLGLAGWRMARQKPNTASGHAA